MRVNTQKITNDLCDSESLLFRPDTKEDARFIQRKLFTMGYRWINGDSKVHCVDECCKVGLILQDGAIYHGPPIKKEDYLLCSRSQLDYLDQPFLTPEERVSLIQEFKKMAARVEDMAAKVDALYAEVMPRRLDKSEFKKPSAGG